MSVKAGVEMSICRSVFSHNNLRVIQVLHEDNVFMVVDIGGGGGGYANNQMYIKNKKPTGKKPFADSKFIQA